VKERENRKPMSISAGLMDADMDVQVWMWTLAVLAVAASSTSMVWMAHQRRPRYRRNRG
jgi:hypothetical protein